MNRKGSEKKITTTRSGRVSATKRKLIEELDSAEVGTSKTVTFKVKKVSIRNNLNKNDKKKFEVGDIVLAKVGKYPVWPGIVMNDPESNLITKSK